MKKSYDSKNPLWQNLKVLHFLLDKTQKILYNYIKRVEGKVLNKSTHKNILFFAVIEVAVPYTLKSP